MRVPTALRLQLMASYSMIRTSTPWPAALLRALERELLAAIFMTNTRSRTSVSIVVTSTVWQTYLLASQPFRGTVAPTSTEAAFSCERPIEMPRMTTELGRAPAGTSRTFG